MKDAQCNNSLVPRLNVMVTVAITIVAKCPGLAGTVPVFDLSRWCPGLVFVPDFYKKGLILSKTEQSYMNSQLFCLFQCIKLTSIHHFTELHEVSHHVSPLGLF